MAGKTILVLGAGVSMEYGFPSGSTLIQEIKSLVKAEKDLQSQDFLDSIDAIQPTSIDSYLNQHKEYNGLVKSAIAQILSNKEKVDAFSDSKDHLYRILTHAITTEKFESFGIVTFNYDRSLEFYWARYLIKHCKITTEQAFKKLGELKIYHIHGRLPELPGESFIKLPLHREPFNYGDAPNYPDRRFFRGDDIERQSVQYQFKEGLKKFGSANLKIIYENHSLNEDAKSILSEASRILFLGFGYHDLNMALLGFDFTQKQESVKIIGTGYQLSPLKQNEIKIKYPAITRLQSCTATQLLSEYISLENSAYDVF